MSTFPTGIKPHTQKPIPLTLSSELARLKSVNAELVEALKLCKEWSKSKRTINSSSIWNIADEAIKKASE